jgi:hypothetical protein
MFKKKKKRNPQHAYQAQIRSLKKRVSKLEEHLNRLLTMVFPIQRSETNVQKD